MSQAQQLDLFGLSPKLTLEEAIEPFQDYLRAEGKTLNTIKGFTSDLQLVARYFGGETRLSKFTTTDLNRFLDWLEHGRDQPCSRKSYARRVTTLKVFFKWVELVGLRQDDPAKAILQRSGPAPLQNILSRDELHALLDYTQALRQRKKPDARPDLLVRLLLDTGIKKSECMEITLEHIDRQNPHQPSLFVRYAHRPNIFKERRIALKSAWLTVLDEYLAQYQPPDVLFPCSARNLEYVLSDAALGAGIQAKVSFEILRWTSAVLSYLDGIELNALRDKLGLSDERWREVERKIIQLAQKQIARR